MKKFLLATTFVALSCGFAMAQGGPNPSGMDAPGAISPSEGRAMQTKPVKMKKHHRHHRHHGMHTGMKGRAMGTQTGTARDTGGNAPAR